MISYAGALLVAKFVPGLHSVAQPLAGALGMRRARFFVFDLMGALLWVGLYVGLGYAFHDELARAAMLARQLDVIANSNAWMPNVEAGQLRRLSVWTRQRLRAFPDVPTLQDLGYGMVVTSPYGIAGPKGMDPEVTEFLHQAFKKMQYSDPIQAYMQRNDMPDEYLGPADYTAFARERAAYEQRMVARLNLSID